MVLRGLLVALLVTSAAAGGADARKAGGTPVAFVAAERESTLVAVDLTTGRVTGRVRLPAGPHNVAAYHDAARGRPFVLVTSPPAGTVSLVDAVTRRVVQVWHGLRSPHDVEVEGMHAFVTEERGGRLVVLDLRTRRIVARLAVPAGPHDVAVSDVALVTHGPSHPALTVVDVRRPSLPRVVGTLDVGGPAHDVSEQPDSALAYVTYWEAGRVGVIDWGERRVVRRIHVGELTHHVQADVYRGFRLWATDHATGEVVQLAARTGRVLRRLRGCAGAHHVAFGGTAWVAVACHDSDALAVWDTRRWRRALVPVGDGPHGVAVAVLP